MHKYTDKVKVQSSWSQHKHACVHKYKNILCHSLHLSQVIEMLSYTKVSWHIPPSPTCTLPWLLLSMKSGDRNTEASCHVYYPSVNHMMPCFQTPEAVIHMSLSIGKYSLSQRRIWGRGRGGGGGGAVVGFV